MEKTTSNLSDMDTEMINKLINTTQNLQQCASLISEWKTANDVQQNRLDQIGRMADVVAESTVTLRTVSDKLISMRQQSSKSAVTITKQVSLPPNILVPAKIKQEVCMDVAQPINPLPLEPVPSTFSKVAKVRTQPLKITNENGAITISSDVQKKANNNDDDGELRFKKRPSERALVKVTKVRRLSNPPSVPNEDKVKKNGGSSSIVGKRRSKAVTFGSGSPLALRRLTRSKSILNDAEILLASLTEKKQKN